LCALNIHKHSLIKTYNMYLCYFLLRSNAPENGKLMAVFVFFLANFCQLINIYTWILNIVIGVFSHQQKYSNLGVVYTNILILSLIPKKGELIFDQVQGIPGRIWDLRFYFFWHAKAHPKCASYCHRFKNQEVWNSCNSYLAWDSGSNPGMHIKLWVHIGKPWLCVYRHLTGN